MKCHIGSVTALHPKYSGVTEARSFCFTHNWTFGEVPVGMDTTCPIGRIEEARDAAIAAIQMEKGR